MPKGNGKRASTKVCRLDRLLVVIKIHFRDDDLAVGLGREQKVLRQGNERKVGGLNLFALYVLVRTLTQCGIVSKMPSKISSTARRNEGTKERTEVFALNCVIS